MESIQQCVALAVPPKQKEACSGSWSASPSPPLLQNKVELVNTLGLAELSSARESDGKNKPRKGKAIIKNKEKSTRWSII